MLRVGRHFHRYSHVTTDVELKSWTHRSALRLWWTLHMREYKTVKSAAEYAFATKNLVVDDDYKVKIKLDPRIEKVKDELIYSGYLEQKRLRFGWEINRGIESKLKQQKWGKAMWKKQNDPNYSLALKYLGKKEDVEGPKEDVEELEVREELKLEKPVHMPYATTDNYDLKETQEETEEAPEPLLNTTYKKLYEKYLEAKDATDMAPRMRRKYENLEKLVDNMETKITQSQSNEVQRPRDKLENVPPNWMTDYEKYDDGNEDEMWRLTYGLPDPSIPISSVPCGGCGALLHCQDSAIPGYLPSELFRNLETPQDMMNTICQRCHFMKNYDVTLEVKVPPEKYPEILSQIKLKKQKAAVILMVDLTDFPCSIWPDLTTVIGPYTPIFVVGNKVDLLPKDCPKFIENVKNSLVKAIRDSGIREVNIKNVDLISAQTGYGVERLINVLHRKWAYKGDVYMIGCTNVGKSTLFNALLQSDYCKVQAVDLIQRATTSPWPGTTLNLLKFPILNPVRWRLALRAQRRLIEQREEHMELELRRRKVTAERQISFATLQEKIGRTFSAKALEGGALAEHQRRLESGYKFGIDETNPIYNKSKWCYDTPGVVHPDQILHLLTTQELLLTLSKKIISPRSFIFKPGQTLFLAGLGRLDLLEGPEFIRITVFASATLPVTICGTDKADKIYDELLVTDAFVVPINDPERLKIWPKLQHRDIYAKGISEKQSACDVLLSSAGWISLTPNEGDEVSLRAWTPEGRGIYQRTPSLLSKSIALRGARMKSSAAYRCGRQVYSQS